jgi:hypothetical protein
MNRIEGIALVKRICILIIVALSGDSIGSRLFGFYPSLILPPFDAIKVILFLSLLVLLLDVLQSILTNMVRKIPIGGEERRCIEDYLEKEDFKIKIHKDIKKGVKYEREGGWVVRILEDEVELRLLPSGIHVFPKLYNILFLAELLAGLVEDKANEIRGFLKECSAKRGS